MQPFRFSRLRQALALAPVLAITLAGAGLAIPAVAATAAVATVATADNAYRTPPKVLVDIVDAPLTPGVQLDPRREWLLLLDRSSLPPIAELAEPELRLGGLRFRPKNHAPSRGAYFTGLRLLRLSDLSERRVSGLPEGVRITNLQWSPDGSRLAFTNIRPDGVELWVAESATAEARRLAGGLNLTASTRPGWLADSRTLVCTLVDPDLGPEPQGSEVPAGPVIRESSGHAAPARTFQDLLKSTSDEALFEHYLTSRVAKVALDGKVTPIGAPGLVAELSPSPDGRYLLVQSIHRPFSYLVPADRFPRKIEVWDLDGKAVRTVADLPLQEEIPISFDSVATGPRAVSWREDAPSTLFWVEALDGGDAGREAAERDRALLLAAPFQGEPAPLANLGFRFYGVTWGNDRTALLTEGWFKTRKTRTWIVQPGGVHPGGKTAPALLFDRSSEDRYSDPGSSLTTLDARGREVLRTADGGRTIFMVGEGASSEGDRPFLDALDLTTRKTRRLFRSAAPYYEIPIDLLDDGGKQLLERRETVEQTPNYYVRDLASGKLRQLTRFPHPTPQLAGIHKELIRYKRADGVQLTATLYTPPGWKPADGPLPMLMWAYPQEFKSADAAGQVTDSPYRFARAGAGSPLVWLTQGYAVLDNPSLPIVGEGTKEPNDTYVQQLVASAQAAVDEVVRRGVADRRRIAIGGHSYGAFMTANLLAHSDLFAAGIAESGAYNRTLTPFGFQSEERDIWHAPEVYMQMSPFMYADKVKHPILLIHGQADNNSGTDPVQSERFFNALKGNGATARLVFLPLEAHGYRGRESVLHGLAESYDWMEKYVKNRPAEAQEGKATAAKP
ncbi:MAG TPA: prolyl oligopeptidase family serine peptidase [Thermoanaerobaculia bacterium]|jgi:dipeptidyl aminopeptidase/acylaminoacyl peptidase|nr:prolyl oligopeptidase family serine peptidase [Thermoanaerobaculia bacterium]